MLNLKTDEVFSIIDGSIDRISDVFLAANHERREDTQGHKSARTDQFFAGGWLAVSRVCRNLRTFSWFSGVCVTRSFR